MQPPKRRCPLLRSEALSEALPTANRAASNCAPRPSANTFLAHTHAAHQTRRMQHIIRRNPQSAVVHCCDQKPFQRRCPPHQPILFWRIRMQHIKPAACSTSYASNPQSAVVHCCDQKPFQRRCPPHQPILFWCIRMQHIKPAAIGDSVHF